MFNIFYNKKKEWWKNKTWNGIRAKSGCKNKNRLLLSTPSTDSDSFVPCESFKSFTWVSWVIPAESQNGPSCGGHGIANFKEVMLRRFHKEGKVPFCMWQQIDGDAIWKYARIKYYDGDMNGGLTIEDAFNAALEMGIFVKGSELKTISRHEAMTSDQFLKTPFIDGHDVSGWCSNGLRDNGQVFEGGMPNGTGGHCTLHVSRMTQNNQNFWQNLNSWGSTFGWHGLFITSEWFDKFTGLEDVMYYVVEPEGWENDDGWRKYIIG